MPRILEMPGSKRQCKMEFRMIESGQHAPEYRSPPANKNKLPVICFFMKTPKCKISYPLIEIMVSIRRIVRLFVKKTTRKYAYVRPYSDGQHAPVYPVR